MDQFPEPEGSGSGILLFWQTYDAIFRMIVILIMRKTNGYVKKDKE